MRRTEMRLVLVAMVMAFGVVVVMGRVPGASEDNLRSKRQVMYQESDHENHDDEEEPEMPLFHPVTKKPLPAQVVYPGDLSGFYTTELSRTGESQKSHSNHTDKGNRKHLRDGSRMNSRKRMKRGAYVRVEDEEHFHPSHLQYQEPAIGQGRVSRGFLQASESHQPMNYHRSGGIPGFSYPQETQSRAYSIPSELTFDGAGFLGMDSSGEGNIPSPPSKTRPDMSSSQKTFQQYQNYPALTDFRAAFNPTYPRSPDPVLPGNHFDDSPKSDKSFSHYNLGEKDGQIEVGSVAGQAILEAFQKKLVQNANVNPSLNLASNGHRQTVKLANNPLYYSNNQFLNKGHKLRYFDQLPTISEDESLLRNHRMEPTGSATDIKSHRVLPKGLHSTVVIETFPADESLVLKLTPGKPHKRQKRSTAIIRTIRVRSSSNSPQQDPSSELLSQQTQNDFRYSRSDDQRESGTGFLPLTGNYNGGAVHVTFPFYGGQVPITPSYPSRPPVHNFHSYSSPPRTQGRQFGGSGSGDHYFHPSEARRYSYGILGSGNFEVIRGGIFPSDHYHGHHGGGGGHGYHDGRSSYNDGNYNNYGTTEIIIDGPIQGFQGFDNFPTHLINALSKHTELTAHAPQRRDDAASQLIPLSIPLQAVA